MRVHEAYTRIGLFPVNPVPQPGAVLLLSDLHLNLQSDGKVMALGHLIEKDFAQAGEVYLLGDLSDSLHRETARQKLEKAAAPFFEALRFHSQRGAGVHYIPGNHDAVFRTDPPQWPALAAHNHAADTVVRCAVFGKTLRLSHGDEHDAFEQSPGGKIALDVVDKLPWVYGLLDEVYKAEHRLWKTLAPLSGALRTLNAAAADELDWRVEMAEGAPSFFVSSLHRWEDAAERLLSEEPDVDVVAMGHTHTPRLVHRTGGVYLNTGDWCEHAVVNWVQEDGLYQQDLSKDPAARFLAFL